MSNLCSEIDLPTKPLNSFDDEQGEIRWDTDEFAHGDEGEETFHLTKAAALCECRRPIGQGGEGC